jgi:aminomethyltransferase
VSDLNVTPLNALHHELGARMVPFAGYEMPVQYPLGVMKEHLHCRARAGLFDVSHMGQVILRAPGGYPQVARAMEGLVPVDLLDLGTMRQRYGFFTNDDGGILDDLMLANRGDHMFAVVNAACKADDIAHMRANLSGVEIEEITDRALLALQGPAAEGVLAAMLPGVAQMRFMDVAVLPSDHGELWISRSGYTGEDGYEISVPADQAEPLARALLAHAEVEPIGLGARDSLRLEAGLCLYGHDIDTTTSPVEARLAWAIQKVRRAGGARAGGFPGAARILQELTDGAPRARVGLRPEGRAPMREGTPVFAALEGGEAVGHVTSGAFGPTIQGPVSMGYVPRDLATKGTTVYGEVRGRRMAATVVALPFTPANFKR